MAANASPQGSPASAAGTGYAVAPATAVNPAAAVTPASTPPNSWCQGRGSEYFGWFGVAPGSSADGGVANDLWWDAKGDASPAQVQVYTGNGGANQQWCEASVGSGSMIFYSDYVSGLPQCLTAQNGYEDGYPLGMRVTTENCASISTPTDVDQLWWVCPRSGNSISIEPEAANPSQVWLDVWGGNSDNGKSAFKPMNPLQLWTGNGQDNQRFTLFPSPGEPGGLPYAYSTGVSGC